jgi:hypothetical protein
MDTGADCLEIIARLCKIYRTHHLSPATCCFGSALRLRDNALVVEVLIRCLFVEGQGYPEEP